jgi:hypothetical protein
MSKAGVGCEVMISAYPDTSEKRAIDQYKISRSTYNYFCFSKTYWRYIDQEVHSYTKMFIGLPL